MKKRQRVNGVEGFKKASKEEIWQLVTGYEQSLDSILIEFTVS